MRYGVNSVKPILHLLNRPELYMKGNKKYKKAQREIPYLKLFLGETISNGKSTHQKCNT